MDYKVIWTQPALSHLEDIVEYLATNSPTAVERVGGAILARVDSLATNPFRGAIFLSDAKGEIREVLATSYRIFYRVDETSRVVRVLALWHSSRDTPDLSD